MQILPLKLEAFSSSAVYFALKIINCGLVIFTHLFSVTSPHLYCSYFAGVSFKNPERDNELVGRRSGAGCPLYITVPSSVSHTGHMTSFKSQ